MVFSGLESSLEKSLFTKQGALLVEPTSRWVSFWKANLGCSLGCFQGGFDTWPNDEVGQPWTKSFFWANGIEMTTRILVSIDPIVFWGTRWHFLTLGGSSDPSTKVNDGNSSLQPSMPLEVKLGSQHTLSARAWSRQSWSHCKWRQVSYGT